MIRGLLFTMPAVLALAIPLATHTATGHQRVSGPSLVQVIPYRISYQQTQRDLATAAGQSAARPAWRDDDPSARWDDGQHNGYYQDGRWTYGPPFVGSYGFSTFQLGYRPWVVGEALGPYLANRFVRVDHRRAQLPRPTRGQRWIQDDRGEFIMVNRSNRIVQLFVRGPQS